MSSKSKRNARLFTTNETILLRNLDGLILTRRAPNRKGGAHQATGNHIRYQKTSFPLPKVKVCLTTPKTKGKPKKERNIPVF